MGLARTRRGVQWLVFALALALVPAAGCHRTSKHPFPLVINEVSPAQPTRAQRGPDGKLLVDASGTPADWVEIFNPNGKPVNLSGYTLTTDPGKPRDFRFPPQALGPGGFVVVALDKNLTAGLLHANFKLKAGGEVVYLFGSDGAVLLDRKTYRNMDADSTAGRYPDGKEAYGLIYAPTPGKPNKRIGVKPPRFEELPLVSPEPSPSNPNLVPVTVTILEDMGVEITQVLVDRAIVQNCTGAISDGDLLPGQARAQEIGRRPASAEQRTDVFGVVKPVAQEAITFAALIPREAEGTILRLRVTAENEIGTTVQFACYCFGCVEPTLILNEFVASNHSLVFDEYKSDGSPKPNVTPDWIEIYNYGDQTVNVADFALLGETTYQELRGGTPLPETSIWRFGYVGIQAIEAGQHFLILADGDKPFAEDANGNVILGGDGKPVPAHKTYARAGETERRYRSTNFKLSAGNLKHPDRGDSFYLLDSNLQDIDSARFNFSDQPGGEIAADRAFGRLPDGQKDSPPMTHFAGVDTGGRILDCPTPEKANAAECEVLPRFSETVFIEPRCPGPGNRALIAAFLSIDLDTAAADTQARPQFEVELSYTLDQKLAAAPLTRGAGLEVRPPTANEIALYKPESEAGTALFLIRAEFPGQPAGTLVVFQLRARDLFLPVEKNNPNLGAWVEHREREPEDPEHPDAASQLSLRFKSGYQRPAVVINEVFPNADPIGLPLIYKANPALTVPQMDYAELYNDSAAPVDLSGMCLDDEDYLVPLGPQGRIRKYRIPPETVIEPHGFLCFFFPKTGQEKDVPPDALAVTGMGLDDCRETLFLLAPDADGNCVVAEARWDIQTTGDTVCPKTIAVGLVPDGDLGNLGGQDLDQLPGPSPCASNCGGRPPRFSIPPIHFQLSSADSPMLCAEPGEVVLLQAAILIDAYAAVVHPAPVQGSPTGIREAKLLVRKGNVETERRIDLAPLDNPRPPDDCWVQVRLNSQIVPPHPPVTFYRVRVVDGNGQVFLSEEFSFGAAGTKPPLAINEVMALNTKTLADEKGKFWPWIEIYNGGSQPADFGGMYLTDIIREPRKWQFPRTPAAVVPPRGFLIVFADGDTTNPDDLHASLTINASGPGDLFLLDKPEQGTCIVDSFHYDFTGQPPDTSIGRIPDGTGTPVVLPLATPGAPNSGGLFLRGDALPNGRVNVTDMVWLFQIIFERAPDPSCLDILDVNDDGLVDLKDGTFLGSFLFLNGPAIPPPYPDPGPDPTPDDLPCL